MEIYLEGMGFGAIGMVLNIAVERVYQWVKKWGESVSLPKSKEPVEAWGRMKPTVVCKVKKLLLDVDFC